MQSKQPIVSITESAYRHITSFTATLPEGGGFRIGLKKTGCSGFSYLVNVVPKPQENDICLVQDGLNIFVSPDNVDLLRGTVIDLVEKEAGQRQLIFNNPNADGMCGCGESFTVKAKGED